jgi:hypothetical protein
MKLTRIDAAALILFIAILGCSDGGKLPDDPDLEFFMNKAARCAYLERAYAHDEDLLRAEIEDLDFPAQWDSLVDSLIATYGPDPYFWHQVYEEILERSREQSVTQEP